MKTIPQNILEVFPKAKYVESDDCQFEDDIIELTSNLHIQVSLQTEYYILVKQDGFIFHTLTVDTSLEKVYKKAIEVATCRSLN